MRACKRVLGFTWKKEGWKGLGNLFLNWLPKFSHLVVSYGFKIAQTVI